MFLQFFYSLNACVFKIMKTYVYFLKVKNF